MVIRESCEDKFRPFWSDWIVGFGLFLEDFLGVPDSHILSLLLDLGMGTLGWEGVFI